MHRKIFLILCAAALFALPSFAQTTNLNGTWKLDNAKSSFGQFPPPASETDVINVDGSNFKQQVTSATQQGSQTYTRACTIDGQEKTLSPDDPNAHIGRVTLSKIKCEWQGASLVVTETANLQGSELTDRLTFTCFRRPQDDDDGLAHHVGHDQWRPETRLRRGGCFGRGFSVGRVADRGRGCHDPYGWR